MLVETIHRWVTRIEGKRASCAASRRTSIVMPERMYYKSAIATLVIDIVGRVFLLGNSLNVNHFLTTSEGDDCGTWIF